MKLFNRIVGLTSSILTIAGGSASATAFAAETSPASATPTPYLQVADSVESTFDFNKANNQLTTYYQISVHAGNGAVNNVVVTPYFEEVQEGKLKILDTNPAGFNATVNDNGTISIDHLNDGQTVGLRIAHTAVYESAAALESAQEITHGVYAEGEDANGDPVHGKNPNADTTVCAVNETGNDSNLATDTDACDVLTQYVPHFRVNALAPKPVKDNGFPNEVKIETQVKLENISRNDAYLAFKAIKGNDLLGYRLKDTGGNIEEVVEASDDMMDQGYYWIPLGHMNPGDVKTVDLHVNFQEKHDIQYEVRGVLDGLNNNVDECTLNYSLDSDADSCDSNAGHATLVTDKAPEITGYVNTDLSALNIPVDIGIDQLTEHADTVKAGNYDIHMDQVPDGVETKNDFTCSSDDLPEGLTVKTDLPNDQCVISGTPTKASKDTYSVTVKFAEGNSYIIPGKYTIKSEATKAVDAYIKQPYKAALYDAAVKATENVPAERARLEAAKKNIENATKAGETAVPKTAPTAEDKPKIDLPLKIKVPDTAPTTKDKPKIDLPLKIKVPDIAPTAKDKPVAHIERHTRLRPHYEKPDQTKSDQTKSDQTKSDQTKSDQTKSDQTKSDQTKSDQTKSDQTKSNQTKSDQTKNKTGKDELAKTGAAVGGLAAVAIIAILGGAFALRRRND